MSKIKTLYSCVNWVVIFVWCILCEGTQTGSLDSSHQWAAPTGYLDSGAAGPICAWMRLHNDITQVWIILAEIHMLAPVLHCECWCDAGVELILLWHREYSISSIQPIRSQIFKNHLSREKHSQHLWCNTHSTRDAQGAGITIIVNEALLHHPRDCGLIN